MDGRKERGGGRQSRLIMALDHLHRGRAREFKDSQSDMYIYNGPQPQQLSLPPNQTPPRAAMRLEGRESSLERGGMRIETRSTTVRSGSGKILVPKHRTILMLSKVGLK